MKGSKINLNFNNPELYEIDENEVLIPKREKSVYQCYWKQRRKYFSVKLWSYYAQKENSGIGELSNNLMNSLIEKNGKLERLKKLWINDFNKLSSPNDIIY